MSAAHLHASPVVTIDLARIRRNAQEIARATGAAVYAVVKSDAYGLGARAVAGAIADVVDGFCVFALDEARRDLLWDTTRKPILTLGPPGDAVAEDYLAAHARPAVASVEQAARLRRASPALCVDTGMQRFACPAEDVAAALAAGGCAEALTHAVRPAQTRLFLELVGGRGLWLHAAGSSLLADAESWLDAVRPGLALYRGAVRVTAPLIEVRDSRGPAGYGGFVAPRHGVLLAGYARGLRAGPCLVNGRPSRVAEVGMQSAFVEAGETDHVGDEVVLLGDGVDLETVAEAWGTSPHEALANLARCGERRYREGH